MSHGGVEHGFSIGKGHCDKRHFLGTVVRPYFAQFLYVLTVEGIWLFNCSSGLSDAIDIKYGYFLWIFVVVKFDVMFVPDRVFDLCGI
jgi:hypothetical protein